MGMRINELIGLPGFKQLASIVERGLVVLTTGKQPETVQLEQIKAYQRERQAIFEQQMDNMAAQEKLRKQNAAAEAKAVAEANKKAKEALAIEKARLYLKQAQRVFDQQAIQIAAALQNKSLTENEKTRLQLMQAQQQLQDAIDNQQTDSFAALETQITNLQAKLKGLQDDFAKGLGNPFKEATDGASAAAAAFGLALDAYRKFRAGEREDNPIPNPGSITPPPSVPQSTTVVGANFANDGMGSAINESRGASTPIVLQIDGQTVASVLANQSASGVPANYDRNIAARLRDSW